MSAGLVPAFWILVIPKRLACAIAAFSAARRSASVGTGTTRRTSPAADSFKCPVGSPVRGSRTMTPFGGSGVSRVIPAAASAREFTQTL